MYILGAPYTPIAWRDRKRLDKKKSFATSNLVFRVEVTIRGASCPLDRQTHQRYANDGHYINNGQDLSNGQHVNNGQHTYIHTTVKM